MDINRLKMQMKNKKYSTTKKNKDSKHNNYLKRLLFRTMICVVLTIAVLILCKTSDKYKSILKTNVYEKNFKFAQINKIYNKYLGSILPFKNLSVFKEETLPTFNGKLNYSEANIYKDGVKLTVDQNYLVPNLESGLVVFIGEKEGYGNTVVIQQIDGIDLWYGNISNVNVNLYDYVEKEKLIGESKNTELYLVYQKNGEFVNYKDYLKES